MALIAHIGVFNEELQSMRVSVVPLPIHMRGRLTDMAGSREREEREESRKNGIEEG